MCQLKKALYGTRSRAAVQVNEIQAMVKIGFTSGTCGSTNVLPHGMAGAGNCAR